MLWSLRRRRLSRVTVMDELVLGEDVLIMAGDQVMRLTFPVSTVWRLLERPLTTSGLRRRFDSAVAARVSDTDAALLESMRQLKNAGLVTT